MLVGAAALEAQNRGTAEATIGGHKLAIEYGRPKLAGRDMVASLEVGAVWRMGMNQATSLTTAARLSFGKVHVAAGDYTLFLRRSGEDTWELLVNSQTGQWGNRRDPANDVAAIPLQLKKVEENVEAFTIKLSSKGSGGMLELAWGRHRLNTDFTTS